MPENTNKVIQLKDAEGNDVSPVVNVGSIYDKNGQKVDNLLSYTVAGTDVPIPELPDAISDSIQSSNLPIRDIRSLQVTGDLPITSGSPVSVNENSQIFSNIDVIDPVTTVIDGQAYMDDSASIKISDNYMMIVFRDGNSIAYRIISLTSGFTVEETTFETELYNQFKLFKLTDTKIVLIGYRNGSGLALWPIQVTGISSVSVKIKFSLEISCNFYSATPLDSARMILVTKYQTDPMNFYLLNCTDTTISKMSEQTGTVSFNNYFCYIANAPVEGNTKKLAVIAGDTTSINAYYVTVSGSSITIDDSNIETIETTSQLVGSITCIDTYNSTVFMLAISGNSLYGCGVEIGESSIKLGNFSPVFEVNETWPGVIRAARFIGSRMVVIASNSAAIDSADLSEYNVVSAIVDDITSTGFVVSEVSNLFKNPHYDVSISPISDTSLFFAGFDSELNRPVSTKLEIFMNKISGGFVFNSTDAIALENGNPGDTIRVGFFGNCECDGIKAGYTLITSGVSACAIRDGWISITKNYANPSLPFVCGEYIGTGEGNHDINLGFSPTMIMIFEAFNVTGRSPVSITLFPSQSSFVTPFTSSTTNSTISVSWSNTGLTISGGNFGGELAANKKDSRYCYIAFKRW